MTDTRVLSSDEDLRSQSAFKGFALHRMAGDHSPLADESGWSVLLDLLVLRGILHESAGCWIWNQYTDPRNHFPIITAF